MVIGTATSLASVIPIMVVTGGPFGPSKVITVLQIVGSFIRRHLSLFFLCFIGCGLSPTPQRARRWDLPKNSLDSVTRLSTGTLGPPTSRGASMACCLTAPLRWGSTKGCLRSSKYEILDILDLYGFHLQAMVAQNSFASGKLLCLAANARDLLP